METHYQHILAALDFDPSSLQVGRRAREIARRHGAKLSLVHVVEEVNISAGYELMPLLPELPDENVLQEAQASLDRIAAQLELPDCARFAVSAVSTKEGVIKLATTEKVDLIVIGCHQRRGLSVLLGSTANALTGSAPCDVLAVRI
ncbi:MAG: universal stress protein [Candidatus Competibacterales bacterium]